MSSAIYFEDLSVGQKWMSSRRTVTESDVVIFAGMTGDFDRAHVDHDYASKSRFKQPLMHGLMGLTWAAGLSTTAPYVRTMALVSVDQWKFLRPVHIGDTVYAVTEVLELASGGRSAGKVTWRKTLVNQDGESVQSGLFVSLVELAPRPKRQAIPAPHSASTDQSWRTMTTERGLDASHLLPEQPGGAQASVQLVHSPFNGSQATLVAPPELSDLSGPVQLKSNLTVATEIWTIAPPLESDTGTTGHEPNRAANEPEDRLVIDQNKEISPIQLTAEKSG